MPVPFLVGVNPVAVSAQNFALCDLGKDVFPSLLGVLTDIEKFFTTNVVEI